MARLYAGLDISKSTTALCVVDDKGHVLAEMSVATDARAIAAALHPYRRSLAVVGHETGSLTPWLHAALKQKGLPALCLDARQTRAAMAAQRNKTDRHDARDIARVLARGFDGVAHVKSIESQRIRLLLTYRRALRRKARDLETSLRTSLSAFGIDTTKRGTVLTVVRKRGQDPCAMSLAQSMLRARSALLAEAKELDRHIKLAVDADIVCQRLMTVPGVGPITALTFRAGVDDPHRFSESRLVGAHFGLTPRRVQSGQSSYLGRISRHGDKEVRTALYDAASSLLARSKRPCALRTWGEKIRARKGFKLAAVACARKLAVILHRLWISEVDFRAFPGGN